MEQIEIKLNEEIIPLIIFEGIKYYPVSYISSRFLLRKSSLLTKDDKIKYSDQIKIFSVNYGENTGGLQDTYCVTKELFIEIVKRMKLGKLPIEQRLRLNQLREYLGLENISEDERFINIYDYSHYNEYIKNAIEEVLKGNPNIKWQQCSKCENYYPYHVNFYRINYGENKNLYRYCNECNSGNGFIMNNKKLKLEYYKHGLDAYVNKRDHEVINIYKEYLNSHRVKFPDVIRNKDDYLKIVEYLVDSEKIDKYRISHKELLSKFKLKAINNICSMDEIYKYIHGEDYYLYPWKFKSNIFKFKELTYDIANKSFDNYIHTFNINMDNPLEFDYATHTKKSKIGYLTVRNILYFVVQYNKFKYPGYMYKQASVNYYKDESSLLFDLKYLIEKDMKIDINKIPLYLTRYNLQKKCRPLYNYIIKNRNESIYYWVDKLYPDKFVEADFEINPYRNEFDSDSEMYIHEILSERFNNVIYNQRNTDRTIKIDGMVPDWFVFTDRGVWVIEYFGLYDKRYTLNSRIDAYINKN